MFKQSMIPAMCLLLLTACGSRSSAPASAGGGSDAQAMHFTEESDAQPTPPTGGQGGQPLADVPYINEGTGDQWGFVLGVSGDGTEPIDLAWFMGNGMQGRDMYEMRRLPLTDNCYALYESGSETDTGITVYVFPGADSIRVTRDGRIAIFKTADSMDHAVSSVDPDYTPERYAIKAGDHGGKWETLQSGETTYVFPSGEYARSQWVKDGDRLYYVDVSGCRMLNNWAHDGFYAGADGAWDKSVHAIYNNVLPENGAKYVDDGGKSWTFQMQTDADGTIHGTARLTYPKDIDFQADYEVRSFGSSAYRLYNVKDEHDCWHVVVLDSGRTLRVSGAGVTERFGEE